MITKDQVGQMLDIIVIVGCFFFFILLSVTLERVWLSSRRSIAWGNAVLDCLLAEWFQNIIDGSSRNCLFDIVKVTVTADDDQWHIWIIFCQIRKQFFPTHDWHLHIQNHNVRMHFLDQFDSGFAIICFADTGYPGLP